MLHMGTIVDFSEWRRARDDGLATDEASLAAAFGHPAGRRGKEGSNVGSVERLDRAVRRLHDLVSRMQDGQGHVRSQVETELLAIMGELTMDLVNEAAARAERLAERLATKG